MPTNNYQPICKQNQLILGQGTVVVVTGWTPPERVSKLLDPSQYAAVGGLVSRGAGIDFLVRNLLANPQVTGLVILGCTPQDRISGSVDALEAFLESGDRTAIGLDIPTSSLSKLRCNLNWKRSPDLASLPKYVSALNNCCLSWGVEPLIYSSQTTLPTVLPGHLYGHCIEGKTIAETWVKIIHRIKTTGVVRPTGYDGQWQELINLTAVVSDEPKGFYFPEPNYLPCDRAYIENYIPQILDDAPYIEGVKYTYGQRLRSWFGHDQIEAVIQKLIGEVDAASAVMSLWDAGGVPHKWLRHLRKDGSSDHQHSGSPCLNHIWVRVVNGVLSLTGLFRSNDMAMAWCQNAMGLRALQQHILDEINKRSSHDLKMGPLITISQSAHIYEDSFSYVDSVINKYYQQIINMESQEYLDLAGNFLIEVEKDTIIINRFTPKTSNLVASYSGKNPLKLLKEVCADAPTIKSDHAGYLGLEIQKAYSSIREGKTYIQDK